MLNHPSGRAFRAARWTIFAGLAVAQSLVAQQRFVVRDVRVFDAAHDAFVIPTLETLYAVCGRFDGPKILADSNLARYIAEPWRRMLAIKWQPGRISCAATSTPARIFHLDDRGSIRRGLRADLILVGARSSQRHQGTVVGTVGYLIPSCCRYVSYFDGS